MPLQTLTPATASQSGLNSLRVCTRAWAVSVTLALCQPTARAGARPPSGSWVASPSPLMLPPVGRGWAGQAATRI